MRWYTKVIIIANRYYSLHFQLYISYHGYISKCVSKFFYQSHLILPFYKYFYIAIQSRSGLCCGSCRSIFIFQVFFTSYMHMHIILNYDIFLDNNKLNLSINKSRPLHAFVNPVLSISFLSI